MEKVLFPDFHVARDLVLNQTTPVEFTPESLGVFQFSCGMGMFHGAIAVEDSVNYSASKTSVTFYLVFNQLTHEIKRSPAIVENKEFTTMLDIDEMGKNEINELLQKVGHGHLGCALDGQPYVLPMHYYFDDPNIYIFTTTGMKTKYMDVNPLVCLQVEEVRNLEHWRSVTAIGKAEHIIEQAEIDRVMEFVKSLNPTLSPVLNRTWIDAWGRAEDMALYRINPSELSGRTTDGISSRQIHN